MKLTADPDASAWLSDLATHSDSFDWDAGNSGKNLKHGISDADVVSIFEQPSYVFAGRITQPAHPEWRGLILGETAHDMRVALIFTRRRDKLRPISCRPMRRNERRGYEEFH